MALTVPDVRARVETDLDDAVIERALSANVRAVDRAAGKADSQTEYLSAFGSPTISARRRVSSVISIKERRKLFSDEVVLATDDWRQADSYRLVRLAGGSNPATTWGSEVVIEYVPEVDEELRDETVLRLVEIDVNAGAYDTEKVGDWSGSTDWKRRRKSELARVREGRSPIL